MQPERSTRESDRTLTKSSLLLQAESRNDGLASLETLLNRTSELIEAGQVEPALEGLFVGLQDVRETNSSTRWAELVADTCRRHPLQASLLQDPFTERCFLKPRGYAGDAVTLDYIYDGLRSVPNGTTELGRAIFKFTTSALGSIAVRNRRSYVARLIAHTAQRTANPRVLSIACGHLREAELSIALQSGRVSRLLALDQDPESLAAIDQCYGHWPVETLAFGVRDILRGRVELRGLDLVYTTGLFDYLTQPVAKALTRRMLSMLGPGGELLIANFRPGILDAAYMESFMDWKLIYRSEDEMMDLVSDIPVEQVEDFSLSSDANESITFLRLTRT